MITDRLADILVRDLLLHAQASGEAERERPQQPAGSPATGQGSAPASRVHPRPALPRSRSASPTRLILIAGPAE
jgi:hypothetical protein